MSAYAFLFQAIKAASDSESEERHLSGLSVTTLEGTFFLFQCLHVLSLPYFIIDMLTHVL